MFDFLFRLNRGEVTVFFLLNLFSQGSRAEFDQLAPLSVVTAQFWFNQASFPCWKSTLKNASMPAAIAIEAWVSSTFGVGVGKMGSTVKVCIAYQPPAARSIRMTRMVINCFEMAISFKGTSEQG